MLTLLCITSIGIQAFIIFPDSALDAVCEDSLPGITKPHVKDL
jgi:hypothetical protein